jgi:hypothetical protein
MKEPLLIHIFNAITGLTEIREMTPEEVAEHEARITDPGPVADPD